MNDANLFEWCMAEPLPPQALVPKPVPSTAQETLAIEARGLTPFQRLELAPTPSVMCYAPRITQTLILDRLNHENALQVACWAPIRRFSVHARLITTCYNPVLSAFLWNTWRKVPPALYVALYGRGMPKKDRLEWALGASEKDRTYFAALRGDLYKEDRIFLMKNLGKDAVRYFEYRTGLTVKRYNFQKSAS